MNVFESWGNLFGTIMSSVIFFVLIVVVVRLAGKRITANMNNFDWIVTVAIGSLASAGILAQNVSIADAAIAIILLAALQWLTTWASVRYDWVARAIKPYPRLLTRQGRYLRGAMRDERVSEEEIQAVLRGAGYASIDEANWVILETNGEMTVIPKQDKKIAEAELLADVIRRNGAE